MNKIVGTVKLTLKNGDKIIDSFEGKNMVVANGRQVMANMACGKDSGYTVKRVNYMKCGDNSKGVETDITTSELQTVNPVISNALATSDIAVTRNGSVTTMTFSTIFTSASEFTAKEIGLFFDSTILFARYTFPVITIKNPVSLEVEWAIQIPLD